MRVTRCLMVAALLALAACGDDDDGSRRATPTATVVPTVTATATAVPTATPTPDVCPLPLPFCGGEFPLNTEMTTNYGPAWADVNLGSGDFLPCFGPYALCYYADCTVSADGTVSNCPCYEWFGPNFVLINAILNADSYQATVEQCTADPASCQVPNGAPVCREINRGEFYPNATRVSTFSFYLANSEPIGFMSCVTAPGPYAGCMTAPCDGPISVNSDGTSTIHCDCPIYDGPFQLGKDGLSCDIAPQVWSAAYAPNMSPPDPCDMVPGPCVPDAPENQCGCPLYTGGTAIPPSAGVNCQEVCREYDSCLEGDVQLGYTCDATLCTSSTSSLVFDACLGLQNCDLSEIFKAESAAGCSCCGSQLCNCDANDATDRKVFELDEAQRAKGQTPQCDINGTLCGTPP